MAQSLFYQLTMHAEGTPVGIIRKVSNQDGSEAHRRLSSQYDPQNMGSSLSRLMSALEFDFGGEAEFLDNMAKFEISIEEYEKLANETLSDNIRTAVLIARAPEASRNHVLLAMPKEEIHWARIKKVAADFLFTKQSMPGGPSPMDIGPINGKGGKEHGKGKGRGKGAGYDSKGKDKDKTRTTSSGGGSASGEKKVLGHCGRRGNLGRKQKDCYAKVHSVSTWNSSGWDESWGSWDTTYEKEKGAAPSREDASATASANAPQRTGCEDAAWIFAIGGLDGPSGASVGQTVDVMVDTGADKSARGPSDFPDYPITQDKKPDIKVANGTPLRHFGDKQVNLTTKNDDEISVIFHATEAAQPIPSVYSIHEAGAGEEFPPARSTSSPSITRDSRSGRSRLGLMRMFGLFFLRATVMSYFGAKIGADGLVVNNAATTVPEQHVATQVGQPVAPAVRRERIKEAEGAPVIQIGYLFGKTHRYVRARPVMHAIDHVYHCAASVWREAQGGGDLFLLKCLKRYVEKLGLEKVIIQCDPENAAKDAAVKVASDIGSNARFRFTLKTSKGSKGMVERPHSFIEGMTRTWRGAIGAKYGIVIELRRCAMKVLPLGETVMWRHPGPIAAKSESAWGCGIYLGRSLEGDSHICGTRRGIVLSRSIRRLVESEGYDKQLLLAMKGIPSDTKAPNASTPVVDRPAVSLKLPQPARLPRPADAAPGEGQPGPPARGARFAKPQEGGPGGAEAAAGGGEAMGDVGDAPQPVAKSGLRRAAVEEPESSAGKRASDEAPAVGEAHKERNIGMVRVGSVSVANVMGYPDDAELCAPCELDPSFELRSEAHYDDDDGECLDPDAVREGIKREAKCMEPLGVGEVAERPRDKKARGTRWCRRKKGEGVRSRFVAKQFRGAQAGDFFPCTPRTEAVRALMAAALLLKHFIVTTDFSAAFMHAPVKEIQEGIAFGLGFEACKAEPTIYHHIEKGIRVVVHTDDPLASGPTRGALDEFFDEMAKHLAIKGQHVLGESPVIYLGSSLQSLDAAGASGSRPVGAAGARPDLTQPGAEQPLNSEGPSLYRRYCGEIQHPAPRRLDAMPPLKELGPRAADMKCLKHLLRYLNGTVDLAMAHRSTKEFKRLRGSADSDWAGCHETRKSTACGMSSLAQSSPEAEYLAAVELAAEMLYVKELVKFMGFDASLEIECDAPSAIAIASWRGLGRLRHLGVKWLWLQQLVGAGQLKIAKVKGAENPPDVGAKFLGKGALEKCRTMLGLVPLDVFGTGIVAALSASRGARYLATFMVLVNCVRAQPGASDGGPDAHVVIMTAWPAFCMLVGAMLSRRCWCWCIRRPAARRTGKGCSKGKPSGSSTKDRSEPEPDPPPAPCAPCRGPSEPRGRAVLLCNLGVDGAAIHSSPNCQALRNRVHRQATRSGCLVRAQVLGQGLRVLHRADSDESAVHTDAACRGLRLRRRRLVSRGARAFCFGHRG
ncbi:unnamed protein product [Prorocentrum cordatum]|uniref:Reverse transcriptase Ty1/copia-type domain-containing protein n=1 Tax=Prorocentrum cordatum TaxID=2364126 RepID=A0ABN9SXN2_9DINO|nr:unnamed protein product [Polarella glacialis]